MNILFYDHGLNTELAIELAREDHRVYYFTPFDEIGPRSHKAIVGKGLEGLTRVEADSWERAAENCQILVFPDGFNAIKVDHLKRLGLPVWGAGQAERLEHDRIYMRELQKKMAMSTPKYVPIVGITKLIAHLKTVKDKWVKVSRFRGDIETFHHSEWDATEASFLGRMLVDFGGNAEHIDFIVEDPIEGVEVGYDGFVINGQFPPIAMIGYEAKDEGYLGRVIANADLPDAIRSVNTKLSPYLAQAKTFFSTELRIAKDKKGYLIDPCIRCPHPPMAAELCAYDNIASIVIEGTKSNHLISPNPICKYVVAIMVESTWTENYWAEVKFPSAIRRNIKLSKAYRDDAGRYWALPGQTTVATCVGTGQSIEQALSNAKKVVEQVKVKGGSFNIHAVEELANTVVPQGKKLGIQF